MTGRIFFAVRRQAIVYREHDRGQGKGRLDGGKAYPMFFSRREVRASYSDYKAGEKPGRRKVMF